MWSDLRFRWWRWRRNFRRFPPAVRWAWRNDCRVVVHVYRVEEYEHSFFVDSRATRMLFEDASGTLWWRAWGVLRPSVKTRDGHLGTYIDELGGMSWTKRGPHFVCEHATTWPEVKRIDNVLHGKAPGAKVEL